MSTYLYRIVVNVAQDEWKRRRKERIHLASEPVVDDENDAGWIENLPGDVMQEHVRDPEQKMVDAELVAAVDAAMAKLPEMERAVLVLYHQEECSYEGIAAALALPVNTVRTHLHRGRKRLNGMLSPMRSMRVRSEEVEERKGLDVIAGRRVIAGGL